ncbi:dienelactone hydrolase family protein [soil metagenome]
MHGETLTITTPDGAFEALVRRPAQAGDRPAVVVIQEIFGVNHTMRQVADDLAALGYLAVVPDLFWRFEPGIELDDTKPEELARAFELFPKVDVDKATDDVAATIAAVRSLAGCNGKVGAVGYCLGGLIAFLTATRTDADAVVSYYGVNIDKFTPEAEKLAHPLLLHIAGEDQFVPPAAQEKIVADLKNHPQIEIARYPGRDHAFARKGGDGYHAADAEAADARTEAFFKTHLGA